MCQLLANIQEKEERAVKCEQCFTEIHESYKFCPKCGMKLTVSALKKAWNAYWRVGEVFSAWIADAKAERERKVRDKEQEWQTVSPRDRASLILYISNLEVTLDVLENIEELRERCPQTVAEAEVKRAKMVKRFERRVKRTVVAGAALIALRSLDKDKK
jgi:hypothetical protein